MLLYKSKADLMMHFWLDPVLFENVSVKSETTEEMKNSIIALF